jgi:hypothetical protein
MNPRDILAEAPEAVEAGLLDDVRYIETTLIRSADAVSNRDRYDASQAALSRIQSYLIERKVDATLSEKGWTLAPVEGLEALRALSEAATPGPWFWNSYNAIFAAPLVDEYNRLEAMVPNDAPDDDPRWDALPETIVAGGPRSGHGDLATAAGARDLPFIVAAVNYVRRALTTDTGRNE